MTEPVPPPPPPPDSYILLGKDGQQHPVRLPELRAWAVDGSITAAHQVYSHATGKWCLAGELPELRDVLGQSASTGSSRTQREGFSTCGCVTFGGILLIVLLVIGSATSNRHRRSTDSSASEPTSQQRTSAGRDASMQRIVGELHPLFESYEFSGPASVNLQLNPAAWNGLSRDEQQQLMDELASKQIVRDVGATLHLRVLSSEVGTIGPGWSGDWKFRRSQR